MFLSLPQDVIAVTSINVNRFAKVSLLWEETGGAGSSFGMCFAACADMTCSCFSVGIACTEDSMSHHPPPVGVAAGVYLLFCSMAVAGKKGMSDLCGSVTELYSLPKGHFHQGMKKKKKIMIWVGGCQVACRWQTLSR